MAEANSKTESMIFLMISPSRLVSILGPEQEVGWRRLESRSGRVNRKHLTWRTCYPKS